MERISKNVFYQNDKRELQYNKECENCPYKCKQSFRATIIQCKKTLEEKNRKKGK